MPAPSLPDRPGAPADGRRRERRPRVTGRSVVVAERISRAFITFGGVGTVVAVATIFGFLLWVVIPLFKGASVGEPRRTELGTSAARPLASGTDEHGVLVWTVFADGALEVAATESGTVVERRPLVEGPAPTAFSISPDGLTSALGFADGSVRLLRLGISTALLEGVDIPNQLEDLAVAATAVHGGGVAQRLVTGEVRIQRPAVTLGAPLPVAEAAVVALDRSDQASGQTLVTLDARGRAAVHRITERVNPLQRSRPGKLERVSVLLPGPGGVPFTGPGAAAQAALTIPPGSPIAVAVPGAGDNALLIWADGPCLRYDLRDLDVVAPVEFLDLVPSPEARVTAVGWVIGKTTLLVGDSTGLTQAFFRTKPHDSTSPDGSVLTAAKRLEGPGSAVAVIGPSQRTHVASVGYADGSLKLFAVTGGEELLSVPAVEGTVAASALAPKGDALLARTLSGLVRWPLDLKHPEASPRQVFGKVWYEGLPGPAHVWQSTGGTDDFEPKLGLMPLIFGTLKATLFSMLFGVPIALLAAIFTSEFLSARLRVSVKSVIEIMASLPSVVLGFLAGVVVAPFVQSVVPAVLTAFLVLPCGLLLAAHLWQLMPNHVALRLAGWPRLFAMVSVFPLCILASGVLAPLVERTLFRGDLLAWLDHRVVEADLAQVGYRVPADATARQRETLLLQAGMEAAGKAPPKGKKALLTGAQVEEVRRLHGRGASGGWVYLMLPLAAGGVLLAMAWLVNPWIRHRSAAWSRRRCAGVALGKFALGGLAAVGLALALGQLMAGVGLDPRGSFAEATRGEGALMGGYIQKNALVVGFLMGFAIIPVIYTLAEDALSSVPQHLRLGSLAAGATPWQTATRIIIPTAMSGLFSAVMIGLGRAVGETMIVVMATGNTSIMEWNVFNGLRTLSANIATEIPEAPAGGTHYRVLFLSAFTLFAMTFALNTVAEVVRRRFRKRAFQL